jgi:hypothetical protein
MTKAQAISQMLIEKIEQLSNFKGVSFGHGDSVKEAIDFVLGEGTYDKLVSDLYDELRAAHFAA